MVPKSPSPRLTALAGVVFLAVAAPASGLSLATDSQALEAAEERRDEGPAATS